MESNREKWHSVFQEGLGKTSGGIEVLRERQKVPFSQPHGECCVSLERHLKEHDLNRCAIEEVFS